MHKLKHQNLVYFPPPYYTDQKMSAKKHTANIVCSRKVQHAKIQVTLFLYGNTDRAKIFVATDREAINVDLPTYQLVSHPHSQTCQRGQRWPSSCSRTMFGVACHHLWHELSHWGNCCWWQMETYNDPPVRVPPCFITPPSSHSCWIVFPCCLSGS